MSGGPITPTSNVNSSSPTAPAAGGGGGDDTIARMEAAFKRVEEQMAKVQETQADHNAKKSALQAQV